MPSPRPVRRTSGPGRSRRPGGSRYTRDRGARTRVGRSAGRPAARRSAAEWRNSGLTGRAAVLGLVGCALVLALAFPTKQYLSQRSRLADLDRQRSAAQERVAALTVQARQLRDPAYVRAMARKRLQYVMPGDSVYLVIDHDAPASDPAGAGAPAPTADPAQPWYGQLWRSVLAADRVPGAAPPPAGTR
ncbi:MAG: septum formation initiator family protein [Actinobacteria bacterium]|nr:septum formation initiator family protein [Actinomycetota bacterium]MBI3686001.1 septum formation initiator family protein [Actinomycetota bacterium]